MAEDSIEPLITECPGCHTRFRVTEAQLAMASGRVRCGACLNVFRGADHLVLSLEEERAPEDPDAALDALLNELSEASAAREKRPPEPAPVPRVVRDPTRREAARSPSPSRRPEPRVTVTRDVPRVPPLSSSGAPLSSSSAPLARSSAPIPASIAARLPVADDPGKVRLPTEEPPEPNPPEAITEPPALPVDEGIGAFAPAAEDVAAANAATPVETPPAAVPFLQAAVAPSSERATEHEVEEIVLAEESAAAPFGSVAAPRREVPRVPVDPLGLGDPPFGIDLTPPRRRRGWLAVSVMFLAVIALAALVLWLQFGTWSRDPQMRPAYAWMCNYLGCTLPVMRAVDQFRTKNLVVRSHPDTPGALQVDAIIVNDAPFAQPFPRIELRFSAMGGNLVSAQRFEPAEYLEGDAAGAKEIGAHTPVHIAVKIPDPGPQAVNYIIAFQ